MGVKSSEKQLITIKQIVEIYALFRDISSSPRYSGFLQQSKTHALRQVGDSVMIWTKLALFDLLPTRRKVSNMARHISIFCQRFVNLWVQLMDRFIQTYSKSQSLLRLMIVFIALFELTELTAQEGLKFGTDALSKMWKSTFIYNTEYLTQLFLFWKYAKCKMNGI